MDWGLAEDLDNSRRAANKVELEKKLERRDNLGGGLVIVSVSAFVATLILRVASDPGYIWGGWLPDTISFFVYIILFLVMAVSFLGGLGSLLDLWLLGRTIPGDRVPSTPWTIFGYLAGCGITVWLASKDFF
jgi:hypothetical protein